MTQNNHYEMIVYPKLHHVVVRVVEIIYRSFHTHREMELGLVLDGSAQISLKGNSFKVKRGSLFYFNSGQTHEICALTAAGIRVAYIQIANNFAQEYLPQLRDLEITINDINAHLSEPEVCELTQLVIKTIEDYYKDESDKRQFHWMQDIIGLLTWMVDHMPNRQHDEKNNQVEMHKMNRLQRIVEYLDLHFTEKVSLSNLAEMENVTTTHISHFIHDNLNMSFQEYMNKLRFERAIRLMQNTNLKLIDVSMESGFSDLRYMNKMFYKHFGCSPSEYRRNMHVAESVEMRDSELQEFASYREGLRWLEEFIRQFEGRNTEDAREEVQ